MKKNNLPTRLFNRAALPWLCLAAAWIFAVWFQWAFCRTMLDSDMASEMVLANQLNREGRFISPNWFYSSELRVFCQQLLFKLGLWIFPQDWHAARTLAQAILMAILAASSLFFFRAAKLGKSGVLITAALMCPISFWYMFHGVFGGFYFVHIILVLLIAGLVLRLARCAVRAKTIALYLALAVVSLAGGLNGVRILMCITLPLVVSGVCLLVLRLHDGAARKPFFAMPEVRMLAASLFAALFSAIGFLVNSKVFAVLYHFKDQNQRTWSALTLSKLADSWADYFAQFGYPGVDRFSTHVSLFSAAGLLGVFGALLGLGVAVCLLRLIARWKVLNFSQKCTVAILVSCLLVMGVSFTCTSGDQEINGSYWLPLVPFGFAVLVIEAQTEDFRLGATTKRLLAGLFAVSVLASSASTLITFFKDPLRADAHIIPVAEWLVDNGYTRGYASFWNANVMTEVTNGKLELWATDTLDTLELKPWLQNRSHLTPPDGRIFILLKKGEVDYGQIPYYTSDKDIAYEDGYFTVLAFDSAYNALDIIGATQPAADATQ